MSDQISGQGQAKPFAEKLLKPDGFWRLLDETVFQFNDLYRRFWRNGGAPFGKAQDGSGTTEAFVVPAMFDKQSRTFNWIALADPFLGHAPYAPDGNLLALRAEYLADIVAGLADKLGKNEELWSSFVGVFDDSPHSKAAIDLLNSEIISYWNEEDYKKRINDNNDYQDKLFHSLSIIYSSYSHPRNHSFEGCFYTALEKFGSTRPDIIGLPIFGRVEEGCLDLSSWINLHKLDKNAWITHLNPWHGKEEETIKWPRKIGKAKVNYSDSRQNLSQIVYDELLDKVLSSWPITIRAESPKIKDFVSQKNFMTLLPIYDVWIGNAGYGCLQAVLLVSQEPPPEGEVATGLPGQARWETTYKEKVLPRCEGFSQGLSATAIRRAIATPIEPPYDLVSHFLKILAEVQDWDEAVVYRSGKAVYCFKREDPVAPDGTLRVRIPWVLDDGYAPGVDLCPKQAGGLVAIPIGREKSGREKFNFYMWWTCEPGNAGSRPHYDLWSEYFLPELTEEERGSFRDVSIRFKFPKACRIPPQAEQASRDYMVEVYLRQQLELMRALVPKVRARRAAMRNAVSAIMGRNMSHNIGSHVLARYAAHTDADASAEPRSDLMSYLQKRMDFLAEVSTADRSYWAQPMLLKQQLDRLNYDEQVRIYKGDKEQTSLFPPLLKYITGKDKMRATVCLSPENDSHQTLFSCPGGEVGVHALYVILENIIRNSARHNGASEYVGDDEDEVRLDVIPTALDEDLIELRILDKRSRLRRDGTTMDNPAPCGDPWEKAGWAELKQRQKLLPQDEQGMRVFPAVPDRLNWIIQGEAMLDRDGRPAPKYWGLREMQICAHYLRELSLSDLENGRHIGADPAMRQALQKYPVIGAECFECETDEYCLSYVVYVPKAKLCAKIVPATNGEPTDWQEKQGLAELRLSAEALAGKETAATGSRLGRGLDKIGGYSFATYLEADGIDDWIGRNRDYLPVRTLRLAEDPDLASALHLEQLAALEPLHRAYAHEVARLPEGHHMAGFAIAEDRLLAARTVLGQQDQQWAYPIACAKGRWGTWPFSRGKVRLSAAFWIDHANNAKVDALRASIRGFNDEYQDDGCEIECVAWEPCFSDLLTTNALESLKRNQGWELLAASFARVVVLDERVQSEAATRLRSSIEMSTCWEGMGVIVPPQPVCDLDKTDLVGSLAWLSGQTKPVDFLLIHLSLLERFCSRSVQYADIPSVIDALIGASPHLSNSQVILVTGRGAATFDRALSHLAATDSAKRLRYLPVSAFLEYLVRSISKLGLMRVLWSASRPRGK